MARGRKKKATTEAGDQVAAEEAREEQRDAKGSNSRKSERDMQRAHETLAKHENVIETAKSKLRQAYKDLKADGFNLAALKRARKDLREDPLDAQMNFEDYTAYRALLGIDDAVQAAKQAEDREANEADVRSATSTNESIAKAAAEGLAAGKAARDRIDNPYGEGSPEYLSWDANWLAGQRQNVGAEADAEREPAAAAA